MSTLFGCLHLTDAAVCGRESPENIDAFLAETMLQEIICDTRESQAESSTQPISAELMSC